MTTNHRDNVSGESRQNRLASEQSPYLLQHADNPVDWYPWGEEAFAKAAREDKPIFLSIGYSTCHWCHVMEHESFEDSTVAAMMNEAFVNIKVDREERPDIDHVYMTVCQMMTGSGGWPLTIVMTPDREPFFAATYIPKDDLYGRMGMKKLIPQIETAWETDRDNLLRASAEMVQHLMRYSVSRSDAGELGEETLRSAYNELSQRFDASHGGFGTAPKFPVPHQLLFLLRHWKRTGDEHALEMIHKTLDTMASGGIYDHVGFGFHRYSTDNKWFAPHFEKMLYDQALLIMAYTEGYLATGKSSYRRVAEEIIAYVERDMSDEAGGFYSAEDADSEGIEGKFYLWTAKEIEDILPPEDAILIKDLFGIEDQGNFSQEVNGGNILFLRRSVEFVAKEQGQSEEEMRVRLETIRKKLFAERKKRIHPHKDDKILADWNGLMIAALAKAGRAFNSPSYTRRAEEAAAFVLGSMVDSKGRLVHRYRRGEAGVQSNVDDYAYLVWGLIELYQTSFDVRHLERGLKLNDQLLERFWDEEQDGLFISPSDGEELIVRMKELYDGAIPSGNSVAMLNMVRLGRITADSKLEQYASRIARIYREDAAKSASSFAMMMSALDFAVGPTFEVVLVGDSNEEDLTAMTQALHRAYVPGMVVVVKPRSTEAPPITKIAPFTVPYRSIDNKATAYVCVNHACELPTTDVDRMLELLGIAGK